MKLIKEKIYYIDIKRNSYIETIGIIADSIVDAVNSIDLQKDEQITGIRLGDIKVFRKPTKTITIDV